MRIDSPAIATNSAWTQWKLLIYSVIINLIERAQTWPLAKAAIERIVFALSLFNVKD